MYINFETQIRRAQYLHKAPSLEERPFDNKYEARIILNELKASVNSIPSLLGIIDYNLGFNYLETEESSLGKGFFSLLFYYSANQHMLSALAYFSKIENPFDYLGYV